MSDATPAYIGYRRQTLYTLARVLEPCEKTDIVFQPEGAEDLAVWDTNNHLLEAVQVKAHNANLTLSSFSPQKADSFFYRVYELLNTNSKIKPKLVSFGGIGIELLQAVKKEGKERQQVAQKIAEKGFLSEANAKKLLNQLQIISVTESELKDKVFVSLKGLCTGIDPESAFEMLNFWLYICAENKTKITQNDVIQRINDIGRFIAERNAHHSEWFRSIVPVENSEINTEGRENLSDEFYRGISARYEHILAGVDKPRIRKLNEVAQKFKEKQIVIVHGASGQGKTALAYRYLHDFFPDQWRFQVRLIENRQQALNIATALSGQAKALGIPVAVYLDVSPSDVGWDELIKQLSSHKNIQILVTVREEDFRKANISGAEIQFDEVELQLERAEAEEIYEFLIETEYPANFLDFEDAWNRFGGDGPLMEFVYLITQGDSLRERLQQQVRRIQDEAICGKRSSEELELLRLVSVASAFEARLKLRELIRFLQLPSWQRILELLEEEYLLRTSEDGTLVGGLHPIRSTILTNLLTDPVCNTWSDSVVTFLPFIFEQDVGSFLLYSFSRYPLELKPLLFALNDYQPKSWIAISGVVRALIWLGIREYVESNRPLISEAYEKVQQGWSFVLDFDIAQASPGAADEWLSSLSHLMSEAGRAHIDSLRSRQIDKELVFARTSAWLSHLTYEPTPPDSELAWTGMADVLFWVGRLKPSLSISTWLAPVDLNAAVEILPIEILADMALGLFYSSETIYQSWITTHYNTILERFRQETLTVVLEDDKQNIRTHFIIKILELDASSPEISANQKNKDIQREFANASMKQLGLLRRIFPNHERYGSKGYGHLIGINAKLHDESEKNIPISNFPIKKLVAINSTFKALGEQKLRPDTWQAYAKAVFNLRKTIAQIFEQLSQGLSVYFRKKQMTQILGGSVESDLWKSGKELLKFSPLLPCCAFDEWGFITEKIARDDKSNNASEQSNKNLALEKYKDYVKSLDAYTRACSNFFNQAEWVLILYPYFRNGGNLQVQEMAQKLNIDIDQQARLSVSNLGDALKALPNLQEEFRRFSSHIQDIDLESLEEFERNNFNDLWYQWYFFAFHPGKRFQDGNHDCLKAFHRKVKEIRNKIKSNLHDISSDNLKISILSETIGWEGEKSLWIKIDGDNPFETYDSVGIIVSSIKQAIDSVHSNELRRYAIELTWANFIILPLFKGKSLDSMAWRFRSVLFSADTGRDFGEWNFVPVAVPSITISQLSLLAWNHPRLVVGQKLVSSIFQLSLLASHIKEFQRLPKRDELGEELLQQYIKQVAIPRSEAFQATLDVRIEMLDYFNTLTSLEKKRQPYLIEARQALLRLYEQILPMNDSSDDDMNLEEIDEWAHRLNTIQKSAFSIYLLWVSDVVEEATAT